MLHDPAPQRERIPHPAMDRGECTTSTHRDGAIYTLCLYGELDLAAADRVQSELEGIEAAGASSIVIDLAGLTFMDSTGIRLMVCAHARARAKERHLLLRRGPTAVQRVFAVSGVDDLLPFAD